MDITPDYLDFKDRHQWRAWLEKHHSVDSEAWLILYKKRHQDEGLTLDEAVEEALCFGWIDSTLRSLDKKRYVLRYSPRTRNSTWSVSNIRRVENLIREERMTEAGLEKVRQAQENGQWDAAIQRERVDVIPPDLEKALRRRKGAIAAYRALPDSRKKQLIYWIQSAKRPETRDKRIHSIIEEVLDE